MTFGLILLAIFFLFLSWEMANMQPSEDVGALMFLLLAIYTIYKMF